MNLQLDLFTDRAGDPQPVTTSCPPLQRYIAHGSELNFSLSMKVNEMHHLWDDLYHRGHTVGTKLRTFANKLCERSKQPTQSRLEKRRLRLMAHNHTTIAEAAEAIPEIMFRDAQTQLDTQLPLDDDQKEDFWLDVGFRPGIEKTWNLTFQQVIDHLKTQNNPP